MILDPKKWWEKKDEFDRSINSTSKLKKNDQPNDSQAKKVQKDIKIKGCRLHHINTI
jgi:hypothetical protein